MAANLQQIKNQVAPEKYELWCKQRVGKGFCDFDLADFDDYFLTLLPTALEELALKKDSYPDKLFNSFEEYQKYLLDIASDFRLVGNLTRLKPHSSEAAALLSQAFSNLTKVFWTLWI